MVDGPTEVTDLDQTESNREIVRAFVKEILVERKLEKLKEYLDGDKLIEHNPHLSDGSTSLLSAMSAVSSSCDVNIKYDRMHRLLVDGNFALSICEGYRCGDHVSYFDLFRLAEGKIVEHWDTVDTIPPRSEWVNENGKF